MTRASITLGLVHVLVFLCALGVGLRLTQRPVGGSEKAVPQLAAAPSVDLKDGSGDGERIEFCLPVPMIDMVGIVCAAHCLADERWHTETVPAGVPVQRGPPCC